MKFFVFFILVFIVSKPLFSQNDELMVAPSENKIFTEETQLLPDPKITIDLDIRAAFTTGEFKKLYPKKGMGGMGFTVLFPIDKKNPLDVGFELGYYFMSETKNSYGYYTPGIGDYDVDIRVSGSMIPLHLVSRIYPFKSVNFPIQPYIEGVAGFRLFKVTQRLSTFIVSTGEELPPEKSSDLTGSWSYGFGGGIKLRLSKKEQLYLNLKINQLYGTETNYMDPESVTIYSDGSYEYKNKRSRTDVVRFSVGIHIMIK